MSDFVVYPHPTLLAPATPRPVDAAMRAAGARVLAAVQQAQAYGLAAAHLGLDAPLVVLSVAPTPDQRDYRVLYNPQLIAASPETAIGQEGSVSLPAIEVPVERALWVELAYDTDAGSRETARFEGFVARVAQHEIEQMNGVFFLSRLSRLKRDTALRKFAKSQRR